MEFELKLLILVHQLFLMDNFERPQPNLKQIPLANHIKKLRGSWEMKEEKELMEFKGHLRTYKGKNGNHVVYIQPFKRAKPTGISKGAP